MKRAACDNPFLDDNLVPRSAKTIPEKDPGTELREFVIESYGAQRTVTAEFVGQLCDRISKAGFLGISMSKG